MPAIYAHARFGHDVLDLLTDSTTDSTMDSAMDSAADAAPSTAPAAARIIRANRPLFDIGRPDAFRLPSKAEKGTFRLCSANRRRTPLRRRNNA